MTTVRIVDGMKYGYKLLGIFIAVALICGAFVAGGIATYFYARSLVNPPTTEYYGLVGAGATLVAVGGLGLYGAIVGLTHKFIADSVVAGMETADLSDGSLQPSISATTQTGDEADEGSEESSADEGTGEEKKEKETDDDSTDEGVFGIDTSKTRAEPTEPRQRQQPPAETAATPDPAGEADDQPAAGAGGSTDQPRDTMETEEPMESPGADHSGPATRPGTPDERSWQGEESEQSGDDGYPKQPTFESNEEPDDWDAGEKHQQPADEHEAEPATGTDPTTNEEADPWDGEDGEDSIDDVVGEATRPDPTEIDGTTDDAEPAFDEETTPTDAGNSGPAFEAETPTTDVENTETEFDEDTTATDAGDADPAVEEETPTAESAGAGPAFDDEPTTDAENAESDPEGDAHLEPDPNAGDISEASSEPKNIDEAPGKFVAKPPADTSTGEDTSDDDDEDDEETAEEFPDDPIVDDGIEDTTDEEGDWEPLDESDL